VSLSGVQGVDWSTRHNRYDNPTAPNDACGHKIADHWHGTNACYVLDRCRCEPCRTAARLYWHVRRQWAREFPYVDPPLVDADPVRAHVDRLVAAGMGRKRIAEVSGVPHGAIWKLMEGDPQRGSPPSVKVRRETAQAILDCPYTIADGARVDATEARAIIAELVARGWAKAEIARRVTGPDAYSLQVAKKGARTVQAGKLRALRALLIEPVPMRVHGPTGKLYQPKPGYRHRRIPANTPGVPPERQERPLRAAETPSRTYRDVTPLKANGKLLCRVCGKPLVAHSITQRCA
jgi:transcriptional regulator with XRE-family HTH domain